MARHSLARYGLAARAESLTSYASAWQRRKTPQSREVAMSPTQISNERATKAPTAEAIDTKLEVVVIPVADVDRAKRFYGSLGWRLDADFAFDNGFRVVQFTPPGSACSIQFGTTITSSAPGSAQSLYLVVSNIEAARAELAARGAGISEVFHATAPGAQFQRNGGNGRVSGPAPDHASYGSFATFSDPDGNGWLLQEIKTRLPGRGLSLDVATLTELLQETEQRHGNYEPTAPRHHWSEWYSAYIVARERGKTADEAARDAALHVEHNRAAQK
jgi:catechol 2,3-dioxygenase-like lactoylglutathione lyase family enzyme